MNRQKPIVERIQEIKLLEPYRFMAELETIVWNYLRVSLEIDERSLEPFRAALETSRNAISDKFEGDSIVTSLQFVNLCEGLIHKLITHFGYVAEPIIQELQYHVNKINLRRGFKPSVLWHPSELISLAWAFVLFLSRPKYWLTTTLGSIVLFAVLYRTTGSLSDNSSSCPLGFWDSLFYSIMAVTTGYGDIHPNDLGKFILSVQVISGYVLLGILVSIIVKKIIRY